MTMLTAKQMCVFVCVCACAHVRNGKEEETGKSKVRADVCMLSAGGSRLLAEKGDGEDSMKPVCL